MSSWIQVQSCLEKFDLDTELCGEVDLGTEFFVEVGSIYRVFFLWKLDLDTEFFLRSQIQVQSCLEKLDLGTELFLISWIQAQSYLDKLGLGTELFGED